MREPALLQSHWCLRCENQYCYSRTGARTSTVTVALVPAVREPVLLQSHWCENQHCYSRTGAKPSTVTVALVQQPALLQSYWCDNQHCYSRTGARTSTIAEQYWSLPWDRQAVTVTLRAALTTSHGTSARPVQMVIQGKKTKIVVQQKWPTVPALPSTRCSRLFCHPDQRQNTSVARECRTGRHVYEASIQIFKLTLLEKGSS